MLKARFDGSNWGVKSLLTLFAIVCIVASGTLNFHFGAQMIDQLPGQQTGSNITFPDEQSYLAQVIVTLIEVGLAFFLFEFASHHMNRYTKFLVLLGAIVAIYDSYANVERLWMANRLPSENISVVQRIFSSLRPPDIIFVDKFGERVRLLEDNSYVYETAIVLTDATGRVTGLEYRPIATADVTTKVPSFGDGVIHLFQKAKALVLTLALSILVAVIPEIGIAIVFVLWLHVYYIPRGTLLRFGEIDVQLREAGYRAGNVPRIRTLVLQITDEADQTDAMHWFLYPNDRETVITRARMLRILASVGLTEDTPIDYFPNPSPVDTKVVEA